RSIYVFMWQHTSRVRDNYKNIYDRCYYLDEYPRGIGALSDYCRSLRGDSLVNTAIRILREKFETVNHYGPQQLMVFHDSANAEERAIHARRAYELVQKLLSLM